MELKVSGKTVRLDQLTEEIRSLPGLSRIDGLSACGPSADGDLIITVHIGAALTEDEERLVADAVARHVPDPQWGLSGEEKELAAILARGEGSLGLAVVERALRLIARTLELPKEATTTPAIDGSE